ncbi:MAG: glutamate--tRNA ligase [Desulfosudaceae bacterium]
MSNIITRFPPSPTGHLHLGGARTALFNWLYARHTGGKFILRIEDTDIQRSTAASADGIFESLNWLGIDWDAGPYYQSRRFDIYSEYIRKMVDQGQAYYCTCTSEELEEKRKHALMRGENPVYDGTCREKGLPPSKKAVIRFQTPDHGKTVLTDLVKGAIAFDNRENGDFIIQRSDGTPTYNLAVVVDDITMGITTVIRGDDHLTNTPRQIMLYQALDCELPEYAHVPMVMGSDRSRLSKRHGAMSVLEYRDQGFLPEGLLNYLVRLGWSYGDQEYFSLPELIEKFSLDHIGKSAGVFNPDKLLAINAEHIKRYPVAALADHLLPFLEQNGFQAKKNTYLEQVIETLRARSKTLREMADKAAFYYTETIVYEEKAAGKFLTSANQSLLESLRKALEPIDPGAFRQDSLEPAFQAVMDEAGVKFGKIAQPVRVALTGRTESPGIFEIMEVLGKETVLRRLDGAVEYMIKNG